MTAVTSNNDIENICWNYATMTAITCNINIEMIAWTYAPMTAVTCLTMTFKIYVGIMPK